MNNPISSNGKLTSTSWDRVLTRSKRRKKANCLLRTAFGIKLSVSNPHHPVLRLHCIALHCSYLEDAAFWVRGSDLVTEGNTISSGSALRIQQWPLSMLYRHNIISWYQNQKHSFSLGYTRIFKFHSDRLDPLVSLYMGYACSFLSFHISNHLRMETPFFQVSSHQKYSNRYESPSCLVELCQSLYFCLCSLNLTKIQNSAVNAE
jgi:hypothetical protein